VGLVVMASEKWQAASSLRVVVVVMSWQTCCHVSVRHLPDSDRVRTYKFCTTAVFLTTSLQHHTSIYCSTLINIIWYISKYSNGPSHGFRGSNFELGNSLFVHIYSRCPVSTGTHRAPQKILALTIGMKLSIWTTSHICIVLFPFYSTEIE
jgi:hypothetical protein